MNGVWIVGRYTGPLDKGPTEEWQFQGAFSTEANAEAACRDFTYFMYGPVEIDYRVPHERTEPPNLRYPIVRGEAG